MKVKILLTFLFATACMLNATAQTIITGRVINEHEEAVDRRATDIDCSHPGRCQDSTRPVALPPELAQDRGLSCSSLACEKDVAPRHHGVKCRLLFAVELNYTHHV